MGTLYKQALKKKTKIIMFVETSKTQDEIDEFFKGENVTIENLDLIDSNKLAIQSVIQKIIQSINNLHYKDNLYNYWNS